MNLENNLEAIFHKIENNQKMDEVAFKSAMQLLSDNECWHYIDLMFQNISLSENTKELFIEKLKIDSLIREKFVLVAESLSSMIKVLKLSFDEVFNFLVPELVETNDWGAEARIWQGAFFAFSSKEDKIFALERLCFLFDKKLFDGNMLHQYFEEIVKLNPNNLKALKYYKQLHIQNGNWPMVASTIKDILKSEKSELRISRNAQELAMVELYHLGDPKSALKVIHELCVGSGLDSTAIEFDAYKSLNDYDQCIGVIDKLMFASESDEERAVLHLKKAQIYEEVEDFQNALAQAELAANHELIKLEATEVLISASMKSKSWRKSMDYLRDFSNLVFDDDLKDQVDLARKRLQDGFFQKQKGA